MRVAYDVNCTVHFIGVYLLPPKNCYSYYLIYHSIQNTLLMSEIQFDVNVAYGFAVDVANNVLPVWWMEVYPFRIDQSE